MADLGGRVKDAVPRIAVVVDVRSRGFTDDLHSSIAELEARGVHPRVVFLEASDADLVRRFESVRRPHPLQDDGRLVDGIARERELVREVRAEADLVIDTSGLNVHELRNKIIGFFGNDTGDLMTRHDGIERLTPFGPHGVDIGVTDAGEMNVERNVVRSYVAAGDRGLGQRFGRRRCGVRRNSAHHSPLWCLGSKR